jgi:endonuclease YncB( thermonuclease family)
MLSIFRRIACLLPALALSAVVVVAAAEDLRIGQASVIDGDTIQIHGQRIRLWRIDAPESDQLCRDEESNHYQCGRLAAKALAALFVTIARPVSCSPTGHDRYRRTVAVCFLGQPGPDIGKWLVASGFALDWPQYSKGQYASDQRGAEKAERGIWRGSFVEPWKYRACRRSEAAIRPCSDGE